MYRKITYVCISVLSFLDAFPQSNEKARLFSLLNSGETGIRFRNDIIETPELFYYKYEYLYNGGGVSIGDINNDGLQDIYFSSTLGENRLYLNLGNLQFRDITSSAGVNGGAGMKTGVNMVDINNDGWLDIFVSKSGPTPDVNRQKLLYINNGDLTFTDKAAEFGLNDKSFTTQSYFFDYDRDGDKDVFMVNHPRDFSNAVLIPARIVNGKRVYAEDTTRVYVSNRIYQNNGGRFSDVTQKAGLLSNAFGLSAAIHDFNKDGWPDIYVANDFNKPDFVYINDQKGGFVDKMPEYFRHVSLSSMGSDINDVNNDGHEDVFVADMAIEDPVRQKQLFVQNLNYDKFQLLLEFNLYYQYPRNVLQLNNGDGSYSDVAYLAGTAQTDWSWAPLIADFDNDGWKDIFVSNGYLHDVTDWDYKNFVLDSIKNLMARGQAVDLAEWFKLIPSVPVKNYFYQNKSNLQFENVSDSWCEQQPSFSNGAAYADLDNDGDLDLVVNNINHEAFIYRNNARQFGNAHFIRFRLLENRQSNKELYGTIVKLFGSDGKMQMQRFDPQRGFMGTMEHFLHFGTGNDNIVHAAEIIFPSGRKMVLNNINAGEIITVYESETGLQAEARITVPLLEIMPGKDYLPFRHVENNFIDFKREPLLPYKCSRKGPYFAKADVNGDGAADIFVGGAAGQPASLFLGTRKGSFLAAKSSQFSADKAFEDNGAVFIDAEGDGDMDLYVVSGGAEFEAGSPKYQDRLYLNDGKGNFRKSVNALPKEGFNGSCVIALDFDSDGDEDLFVGGGVYPGRFPQHDSCMLLRNDKGIFRNIASEGGLISTGIVNDASWEDIDKDGNKELVVVGEWIAPAVFKWVNGSFRKLPFTVKFENSTFPLEKLSGWWNTTLVQDLDNDGDADILLGNRGLNSRITASVDYPCTIYGKDFDNNGSYDALLGYYINGKLYSMYHRDQLIDQMPMMRKRFLRYRHYASTTMDEIFSDSQKKGMDVFTTAFFESGVLINEGALQFRFVPFNVQAQISTINDLLVLDVDKDGHHDVLVCGNSNDPDVSTGNYDGMAALLMRGDGKGHFTPVNATESGLKIKGELRRAIAVDGQTIIFLRNNDYPVIIRYK